MLRWLAPTLLLLLALALTLPVLSLGASWLQFDAAISGNRQFYLQITSSTVPRAQLFYRAASGQWVGQVG